MNFVVLRYIMHHVQNISSSEQLVSVLFDNQPDAVMWFLPIFNAGNSIPVDFQAAYCNSAAGYALNAAKENIVGTNLSATPLMDDQSKKQVLEQCLAVWTSNKSLEFTYFNPALQKHLHVQRSKVNGGILNITRDHTQFENAKAEKEKQAELLHKLVANSPNGVSLYEAIRDKKKKIIDFKLRLCNQKSAEITAFSQEELYKYTVKELMLIRGQSNYFEMVTKVVETGESVYTDLYVPSRNKWIGLSIVKFGDGYLLNYIDITQAKTLEQQARKQAEMLEGILNATTAGLLVLEPVTGASGKILDFKIARTNNAAESLFKLKAEDKTKTFLILFPTARTQGLFDLYCQVISTGIPITKTLHLKGENFDGDYFISISKMGDSGIVQYISQLID